MSALEIKFDEALHHDVEKFFGTKEVSRDIFKAAQDIHKIANKRDYKGFELKEIRKPEEVNGQQKIKVFFWKDQKSVYDKYREYFLTKKEAEIFDKFYLSKCKELGVVHTPPTIKATEAKVDKNILAKNEALKKVVNSLSIVTFDREKGELQAVLTEETGTNFKLTVTQASSSKFHKSYPHNISGTLADLFNDISKHLKTMGVEKSLHNYNNGKGKLFRG